MLGTDIIKAVSDTVTIETESIQCDYEDYQRSLIRLYADMGDYTSAMSQYETLKRVIQRDGSAEVEIETLKLVQKIKKYRKSKHLLSRGSSPVLVKPPIHKFIFIVPVILISLTAIFLFLFTNRTNIFAVEHPYSIAVLPFIFQCKEEDAERFAEVFTIDMTTALAEEEFFKVTPYATMRHYRDSQMTVAEISNEVEVEYILFGSAMKYQECIRFSVQLIDTENDQCIWAETYDCTIEHSVETQNEVVGYLRTCVKREMSNLLD